MFVLEATLHSSNQSKREYIILNYYIKFTTWKIMFGNYLYLLFLCFNPLVYTENKCPAPSSSLTLI